MAHRSFIAILALIATLFVATASYSSSDVLPNCDSQLLSEASVETSELYRLIRAYMDRMKARPDLVLALIRGIGSSTRPVNPFPGGDTISKQFFLAAQAHVSKISSAGWSKLKADMIALDQTKKEEREDEEQKRTDTRYLFDIQQVASQDANRNTRQTDDLVLSPGHFWKGRSLLLVGSTSQRLSIWEFNFATDELKFLSQEITAGPIKNESYFVESGDRLFVVAISGKTITLFEFDDVRNTLVERQKLEFNTDFRRHHRLVTKDKRTVFLADANSTFEVVEFDSLTNSLIPRVTHEKRPTRWEGQGSAINLPNGNIAAAFTENEVTVSILEINTKLWKPVRRGRIMALNGSVMPKMFLDSHAKPRFAVYLQKPNPSPSELVIYELTKKLELKKLGAVTSPKVKYDSPTHFSERGQDFLLAPNSSGISLYSLAADGTIQALDTFETEKDLTNTSLLKFPDGRHFLAFNRTLSSPEFFELADKIHYKGSGLEQNFSAVRTVMIPGHDHEAVGARIHGKQLIIFRMNRKI